MGELVLVRHGETEWTVSRRHTGLTDLPLTANGEDQARALSAVIAPHTIALTLTSPLQRAMRTAQLACLRHVQVEPNLREWDYGGYEGLTTSQIRSERPGWVLWTDGVADGPDGRPGETSEQVGARADRVLARIRPLLGDSPVGDVVLVAHGHLLRVLAVRHLGFPAAAGSAFRLDTGTVSTLGIEHGRPVVSRWNAAPPPASLRLRPRHAPLGDAEQAGEADHGGRPAVVAAGALGGDEGNR